MGGAFVNPQNNTTELATVIDTAQETVIERFAQVSQLADQAKDTALAFLNELRSAADDIDFDVPEIGIFFPAPISIEFDPGDPPTAPTDIEVYLPPFPDAPILSAVSLITDIQVYLENQLATGPSGVNAAVEDLIWRREEERALLARDEARANLTAEWSARGFDLPDGVLVATLTQEEIDYRNKRLDLSRDIAIKQYETAFENTKFIIGQILAMEQLVMAAVSDGNKNTIQKYAADVDGYKTKVQAAVAKLESQIKAYQAEGSVYEAKAKAQASIAEVDVKAAEAQINVAIAQMQIFLKQAELHMHNAEAAARIRTAAAEAGGRIAAQLAAGALSGISVQAQLSAHGTATKSYQGSEQLSETHQYQD